MTFRSKTFQGSDLLTPKQVSVLGVFSGCIWTVDVSSVCGRVLDLPVRSYSLVQSVSVLQPRPGASEESFRSEVYVFKNCLSCKTDVFLYLGFSNLQKMVF